MNNEINELKNMSAADLDNKKSMAEYVKLLSAFQTAVRFAKENGLWEDIKHQSVDVILECYKWRMTKPVAREPQLKFPFEANRLGPDPMDFAHGKLLIGSSSITVATTV